MAGDLLNYPADATMLKRMAHQFITHVTEKAQGRICYGTDVPASNNSDYAPEGEVGDIYIRFSANDVIGIYLCTSFTSTSSFTWTDVYSP